MRSPLPLVLLATLALASSAAAQSIASGDVTGQVRGPDGEGLPDAVVSLRSLDLGITQEAATDMQGRYSLPFVAPGRYELRVEAVGYAPTVYPLVRIEAGTARTINIDLTPAAPPVTHVDTVRTVGTLLGRWRGS
ncbi:MAG: carboxypeptidase-like regulatory domain-containing protein, partial [Gemmatimonadetes bacterium]|nr:carboxypeptidase-like regulatory domain-containing protein [Gemmatimonadota bacterium]